MLKSNTNTSRAIVELAANNTARTKRGVFRSYNGELIFVVGLSICSTITLVLVS